MDQVTLQVSTKYGTVTVTFLDPSHTEPGPDHRYEWNKHVAMVTGVIKINGIAVDVREYMGYRNRSYEKGKELDIPVRVLDYDPAVSGSRREGMMSSGGITPNVREKMSEMYNWQVRQAYEAHPHLQIQAKLVRLTEDFEYAKRKVAEKLEELNALEHIAQNAEDAMHEYADSIKGK